ncbi:hypothetical protein KFE25_012086 [Diacronema lutheri]|uniref:Major facilitator superfamily (MFS) profile domain-containing protein n=1 Tax=Diacronema lutheri TaxID=2081491 RepID=A0A8J5X6N6_DIALT|nr:hypothetical protein KFE25_012086 [Diacronema lutheri]
MAPSRHHRAIVYAAVALDYFAVGMMRTLLPFYAQQLGGSALVQGALEALCGMGQFLGSVLLGRMSDGRGRKAGLAISFGGSALGYALVAASIAGVGGERYSLPLLLLSRVPVGLAKQTITISRAVLADLTPLSSRSAAMQRLYSAMAAGYIVGPPAGGWLAHRRVPGSAPPDARVPADGRTPVTALPAIVACVVFAALTPIALAMLPETSPAVRRPLDAAAPPAGASTGRVVLRPAAAARAAGGVLRAHPRIFLIICAQWLPECAFVAFTAAALGPIAHAHGWSPSELGSYNSAWAIAALCTSVLLGAIPLRALGDVSRLCAGYLSFTLACAGLAAHPTAAALWPALPALALAVTVIRAAPAALVSRAAPAESQGEALGALDAANSLGRVVAPLGIGWAFARAGQRAALGGCAAATLVGLAALLCLQGGLDAGGATDARGARAQDGKVQKVS